MIVRCRILHGLGNEELDAFVGGIWLDMIMAMGDDRDGQNGG